MEITKRFQARHQEAMDGKLDWHNTAIGALALIILLDQFSRNIYRGKKEAFAADHKAQLYALDAINQGFDLTREKSERLWFYMPLMHAENLELQELSLRYISERIGNPLNIKFAKAHAEIISRFGRFPYRNKTLGRENTPEEKDYLKDNSASWGQ